MTDAENLQRLITDAETLKSERKGDSDPSFQAWRTEAQAFLDEKYGRNDIRSRNFRNRLFTSMVVGSRESDIKYYINDLETSIQEFQRYLLAEGAGIVTVNAEKPCDMSKIFIIHGHDGELKEAVARLIEKQGIQAIILSEMTNTGKTIIEKFEENSDVGAAIALFTGDDVGGKSGDENQRLRARQNVIFECGYFMGKLGRNRVMIITEKDVELPSDLQGIVWTNVVECKLAVLQELDAMGFDIDLNVLKK